MAMNIEHRLGKLVSLHPVGAFGSIYIVLGVVIMMFSIALGVYGWFMLAESIQILFILMAIVLFITGLVIVFRWIKFGGSILSVYEKGFNYKVYRKNNIVRWDDVDYISELHDRVWIDGAMSPVHSVLKIVLNNGKKYRLSNGIYKGIRDMAFKIQNTMVNDRFPKVLDAINKGQTVRFGVLRVNKDGIKRWIRDLSWEELEGVEITKSKAANRLLLRKKGSKIAWSRPFTFQVHNLHVFLLLVDNMLGMKTKAI